MTDEDKAPSWISLGPDEEILYKSNPSYITALPSVVLALVLTILFLAGWINLGGREIAEFLPFDQPSFVIPWYVFAVGVVYALSIPVRALLPIRFTWYVVTNRRVFVKEGVFRTDTQSQTHDSIQEIKMNQSPFEKLLALANVADIADFRVSSAGTSTREMSLRNVPDPEKFRESRAQAESGTAKRGGV